MKQRILARLRIPPATAVRGRAATVLAGAAAAAETAGLSAGMLGSSVLLLPSR